MIVVRIIGGLGNQMFQYAAAKALSLETKQKFVLDISGFSQYKLHNYSLQHFNIEANFYKRPNRYIKKLQTIFFKNTKYNEIDFGFNPDVLKLKGDYIFLNGYFQSEKYFLKYEKEIREDFKIISPLKTQTQETINHIEKVNSVSIHIRRGDYLTNPRHNTETEQYYKKAVEIIESKISNPVFFVFSDDIDWVKANMSLNYETNFIDFNDALTNFEDLRLMSACKHNVITNSSFSWWGAWLNDNKDKVVIAPQKWFNDDSNTQDIIPNTWIKI